MKKVRIYPMQSEKGGSKVDQNRGWLKNGNPPGDLKSAPRCGAFARTTGKSCRGPAMINGRCRMHGGKSHGPSSLAGRMKAKRGNWKHGGFSTETMSLEKITSQLIKQARDLHRSRSFQSLKFEPEK